MISSDNESFFSAGETISSVSDDSFCSATETLGDCLRSKFNDCDSRLFNICHLNAQSVPSHFSDLYEAFADTNAHAILISETWFKPQLPSTSYSLPGFVLIRNDRTGKGGGGVAIYLRSDFPFKTVSSSSSHYSASAEFLFLEVCVKGVKILLGVVYIPPSIDFSTEFESVLESLGSAYEHHVIMGDFNINILAPTSPRSRKLFHLIESAHLHNMPLQATHHNIIGEDTWLDLILTSNPSLTSAHGQFVAPGFSHHDLIYLSYILKPPKPKPRVLYRRCFSRLNLDKLDNDARLVDWNPLLEAASVDEKVQILTRTITELYDANAPVRRVRLKRPPAPWMTKGVQMARRRRDRAFHKFRRDRSDENWLQFKAARNRCNQMVRNAKRRHILNNISSSSSSDTWKFLRTLGIGRQRLLDLPNSISLDDLNKHFSTSFCLDRLNKLNTINNIAGLARLDINPFTFSPLDDGEIKKIILSIKSKAVGCDNISRRMIVTILDHLLPTLTHIINFSLTSGSFPSSWRKAYVRPLPKISNPSLPNHFRPISILPFLSKVLEVCAHKQFSKFVHLNNLLTPLQSGFRPGHSTVTALLKVTGDIKAAMEDTKLSVLVLVDFSNAFNSVNHDILLSILSYLMVSPESLEWFSSYLQGRQQSVCIEEVSSSWCNLDSGVPQGGILSPLLFSLFINFIVKHLHCSYHLYADDLQLYVHAAVDFLSDAINALNRDLTAIKNWANMFGIAINPDKCQAMILGSPRIISKVNIDMLPPLIFNSCIIPFSSSVNDLGLILDADLSWRHQVARVSQKVTGSLRSLYRLKNFLPANLKATLVQTLILPILDYGDVCYYDLNADLLNKLDRLLNNCIRFVFNLRKFDHISKYRALLKWLPIRQRREMRALTMLFSILFSPHPPSYLSSHFDYLSSNHAKYLRSSNNRLLQCPSHRSDFIHSTFFVQSVLLWNALPLEIRMANSLHSFKVALRKYCLNKFFDSSQN